MTPEEKSLLERTYKMSEENNTILRKMRRSNRFSAILRVLYWLIILVLGFAAYYFIQPYLNTVVGLYNQAVGGVQSGVSAANSLKTILK